MLWINGGKESIEAEEIRIIGAESIDKFIEEGWRILAIMGVQVPSTQGCNFPIYGEDSYGNKQQLFLDIPVVTDQKQFIMGRGKRERDLANQLKEAADLLKEQTKANEKLVENAKNTEKVIESLKKQIAERHEDASRELRRNRKMESDIGELQHKYRRIVDNLGRERIDGILGIKPCGCTSDQTCGKCGTQSDG